MKSVLAQKSGGVSGSSSVSGLRNPRRIIYRESDQKARFTPPVVLDDPKPDPTHKLRIATARAYTDALAPYELIVCIDCNNGDHHELVSVDPVHAQDVARFFCATNHIHLKRFEITREARRINLGYSR